METKVKRSKEWLLAKELYQVGVAARWPNSDFKFEDLSERIGPAAESAMFAQARFVIKNFKRNPTPSK